MLLLLAAHILLLEFFTNYHILMKLFAAYRLRPIPSEFGFHNPVMEEEMGIEELYTMLHRFL